MIIINPDEDPRKKFTELGSSGLVHFAGRVYEEFLPELTQERGRKVFKQMRDNDPIVGAILFAIEMLIRKVNWRIQPASNEEEDVIVAEFVESCMEDMSHTWDDMMSEIMSMLVFGWSYHEIVYKRRLGNGNDATRRSKFDDGLIGWRKIAIRSQDTLYKWDFDENGGINAMIQQAPPKYRLSRIPIEKALLFKTTSRKNNPEGRSVLRNAYRAWYFKKNIEEVEGIGIERDLAGLPVAWIPPELLSEDASPQEKQVLQEIKSIVQNVRRDEQEGVVFPLAYDEEGNKMYDLELLSTGGSRQFDTDSIISRYDQRIAMTVLADFILIGHESVGSFALADEKSNLFSMALSSWLDSIAEVFNRHAIPRLLKVNGIGLDNVPKLVYGEIDDIDLETLSDYINTLAGAGMPLFPDDKLEQHLRDVADLPSDREEGGF